MKIKIGKKYILGIVKLSVKNKDVAGVFKKIYSKFINALQITKKIYSLKIKNFLKVFKALFL